MSDMEPRRCVNGDEVDAYGWFGRKYLACLGRAGVRAKTKQRTNRRERQERKRDTERRVQEEM